MPSYALRSFLLEEILLKRSLTDDILVHVFPTLEDLESQIDANEIALDRLLSGESSYLSDNARVVLINQLRQEIHDQKAHRLFRLFHDSSSYS